MYEWWLKVEIVTLHANFKDRGYEARKKRLFGQVFVKLSKVACQSIFVDVLCKIHEASVR